MLTAMLISVLLGSNASGKTMIRRQPGMIASIAGYQGPLIADAPGVRAHGTWNGVSLMDSQGNVWATNGTVPQVAKNGKTPSGAGPFSDANYYTLGSGSDVLDFAGDFWGCIVFKLGASLPAGWTVLFDNGISGAGNGGYVIQFDGSGAGTFRFSHYNSSGGTAYGQTANAALVGQINVGCFGRIGNSPYAKLNLGATADATAGAFSVGTAFTAYLGRYNSTGLSFGGTVLEMIFVNASPGADSAAADALWAGVANRVKTRAGITAW